MRFHLVLPLLLLVPVALLAYAPAPVDPGAEAAAADTSRHQNLQFFPEDIEHDRLIETMRGFNRALGVRCGHCHVGAGEDWDFASDEKEHKAVARAMLRMNARLNAELLAGIDGLHEAEGPRVTCWTCHRGETVPARLGPVEDEAAPRERPHEHDGHSHEHERQDAGGGGEGQ